MIQENCHGIGGFIMHFLAFNAGFFTLLAGILGFIEGVKFGTLFVDLYLCIFGLIILGLEFKWPQFLVDQIHFYSLFWGRFFTYLFIGCLCLGRGTGPTVCGAFVLISAFSMLLIGIVKLFPQAPLWCPSGFPPPLLGLSEDQKAQVSVPMNNTNNNAPVSRLPQSQPENPPAQPAQGGPPARPPVVPMRQADPTASCAHATGRSGRADQSSSFRSRTPARGGPAVTRASDAPEGAPSTSSCSASSKGSPGSTLSAAIHAKPC